MVLTSGSINRLRELNYAKKKKSDIGQQAHTAVGSQADAQVLINRRSR